MRFLLTLTCLLALSTSVFAADLKADAEFGVKHTLERVITLPQDQGKWYVSLFGDSTDPQYQRLQQWFETHKGLSNLRTQVHYNEYATDVTRYQKYAEQMPGLPCVRVQNSKGNVRSEFWADYLPLTGEALFVGIKADLRDETRQRRRRLCPSPEPEPTPEPMPGPAPIPDGPPVFDEPEPEPEPEEEASGFPWLIAIAALAIGIGIGVTQGYRKERLDAVSPKQKAL